MERKRKKTKKKTRLVPLPLFFPGGTLWQKPCNLSPCVLLQSSHLSQFRLSNVLYILFSLEECRVAIETRQDSYNHLRCVIRKNAPSCKPTHKESFLPSKSTVMMTAFPLPPTLHPPIFSFTSGIVASSRYSGSGREEPLRDTSESSSEKFAFNAPAAISVRLTAHTLPAQIGSSARARGVCCLATHCTCVVTTGDPVRIQLKWCELNVNLQGSICMRSAMLLLFRFFPPTHPGF